MGCRKFRREQLVPEAGVEVLAVPVPPRRSWLDERSRGAVRQAIEVTLDRGLPEAYDEALFNRKCDTLYRHMFDAYQAGREGIYAAA